MLTHPTLDQMLALGLAGMAAAYRQLDATWYETLRASSVSEKDADTIRGAFVYPGFSL